MVRITRTEAQIAAVVMAEMQDQGWNCYPEVEISGGRADIIGVQSFPFMPNRQCVMIVETKTSWSLSLLEQAWNRTAFAHYVLIAAPTQPSFFYERLCRERGIGMIRFEKSADLRIDRYKALEPRLQRHRDAHKLNRKDRQSGRLPYWGPDYVLARLHEDMKRYAPGTQSSGGFSTPFRRTMDRCEKFVRDHPGSTVKEIIEAVDNHYANISGFKQGVLKWLDKRDGIEARNEGGRFRFYPEGAPSIQADFLQTARDSNG